MVFSQIYTQSKHMRRLVYESYLVSNLKVSQKKKEKFLQEQSGYNYKVAYSVKMIWRVYSPFLNAHALEPSHITNSN